MARNPWADMARAHGIDVPSALKSPRRPNGAKARMERAKAALGSFDPRKAVLALADLVPGQARVVVPFPPTALNPNHRHAHPAQRAGLVKSYRQSCWGLTLEALGAGFKRHLADGPVRVHLDFFPPNANARDDDNLEAAFKAGRDGIAEAIGMDDARWRTTRRLLLEMRGCVVVTIAPDPAALRKIILDDEGLGE